MTYCRLERWQQPIVNSVVSLDCAEKITTSAVVSTKPLDVTQRRPVRTVQVVKRCFYENKDACVTVGKRFVFKTAQGKRFVLLQFPKCEEACCRKNLTKFQTQACTYKAYTPQRYEIEPQPKKRSHCRISETEIQGDFKTQKSLKMNNETKSRPGSVSNPSYPRKSVHFRSHPSYSNTTASVTDGENKKKEIYDYLKEIDKQKAFLRIAESGTESIDKTSKTCNLKDVKQLSGKRRLPTKREREQQRAYRLRKWATISEDFRTEALSDFNVSEAVSSLCSNESLTSELGLFHREKASKDRANNNMAKVQAALSMASSCVAINSDIQRKLKFKEEVTDSGVWCDTGQDNEFIESTTKLNCVDKKQSNDSPKFFVKSEQIISSATYNSSNGANLVEISPKINEQTKKLPIVGCTWWQNKAPKSATEVKSTCPEENIKENASTLQQPLNDNKCRKDEDVSNTLPAQVDFKKPEVHSSQSEPKMTNSQENNVLKHQRQKSEDMKKQKCAPNTLPQNTQDPSNIRNANKVKRQSPDKGTKSSYDIRQSENQSNLNRKHQSSLKRNDSHREKEKSRRKTYEDHRGRYERCRYSSNEDASGRENQKSVRKTHHSTFKPISGLNSNSEQNSSKQLLSNRIKTVYPNPSSVTCSSCAKSLNKGELYYANDDLYLQTPITSDTDPLMKCPSAYLALVNSDNQIIMFQCDCDRCKITALHNKGQTLLVNQNEPSYFAPYLPKNSHKKVKTKKMTKKKSRSRNSDEMPRIKSNYSNTSKGMNIFSLCFWCLGDESGSSDSGGSDSGNDDGDGGEEEGDFVEHGDGPDLDDDSDGGDSGSDSGGEDSFNSAELFDDQNNMMDAKQVLGEGDDSDGGPGSAGSDCSDSLTELRSRSKKGSGTSDEEGEDDDDVTEDDDDFADSWDSIAILERGE